MSLHRFFVSPNQADEASVIRLSGHEAHHAAHVLRLRRGDAAVVLNGQGGQIACEVSDVSPRDIALQVLERTQAPPPPCAITLFQAIPKGKLLESIIQKATELGVLRIVPVVTERVVSRPHQEDLERKEQKWQQTAIEAVKQCGQPWLPRVDEPVDLGALLERKPPNDLELIGALGVESRSFRAWFNDFLAKHQKKPESIGVWIGPEGDFTPAEMDAILASGACPVTLGPLVLRCETAAIYALSVVNYEVATMQSC